MAEYEIMDLQQGNCVPYNDYYSEIFSVNKLVRTTCEDFFLSLYVLRIKTFDVVQYI